MEEMDYRLISCCPPLSCCKSKATFVKLPEISDAKRSDPVKEILSDIKEGLQYVFQTKNEWTFAVPGTGIIGAHAVLGNLIEPGRDKVLVLSLGHWGVLQANIAKDAGAEVIVYDKTPGTRYYLREVEETLKTHSPDILAMVMGESDTTVYQPMDGIGDLCARNGTLLIVDVVAVAGMRPILVDKHRIDAVYANSQKALAAGGGLAPVSLSPRAVKKLLNRLTPPRADYIDLRLQGEQWTRMNPYLDSVLTLSIMPLLYSLREVLASVSEEGLENVFERHKAATTQLTNGLEDLGLEHYVANEEDRMIGMTAVLPPLGKDPVKIVSYVLQNYSIEISHGLGPTTGKVLRFATYGENAYPHMIRRILQVLTEAIQSPDTDA